MGVKSARVLILGAQSYRVSRLARNVTNVQLQADFLYSLPTCNAFMCLYLLLQTRAKSNTRVETDDTILMRLLNATEKRQTHYINNKKQQLGLRLQVRGLPMWISYCWILWISIFSRRHIWVDFMDCGFRFLGRPHICIRYAYTFWSVINTRSLGLSHPTPLTTVSFCLPSCRPRPGSRRHGPTAARRPTSGRNCPVLCPV